MIVCMYFGIAYLVGHQVDKLLIKVMESLSNQYET